MSSASDSLLTIENSISYMNRAQIATSRGRGWNGVTFDLYGAVSNVELDVPPSDHHALAYCLQGSGRWWQRRGGRAHESIIQAGSVIVIAAGDSRSWRGTAPPSLRMRIPCKLLNDAAGEIGRTTSRSVELIDMFHTRDIFIGQLAPIFVSELERPPHPAQSLIVESASSLLAAHLLRHYDVFKRGETKLTGLGPRSLASVVSYIEDHAQRTVTLDELAGIANVSRFHFARMFKLSTGLTPMTYVEQTRISRAQDLIKKRQLSLAEVGIAVGFADQSHFTRRFRLHVGCTPSDYASSLGIRPPRRSYPAGVFTSDESIPSAIET
jgi:AraC family transcriptional regulator